MQDLQGSFCATKPKVDSKGGEATQKWIQIHFNPPQIHFCDFERV